MGVKNAGFKEIIISGERINRENVDNFRGLIEIRDYLDGWWG